MSAQIHIERMMHRQSVAIAGESAASYALIKLIPSGDAPETSLPLDLALVLDVSGSMYEQDGTGQSRLERVQRAAEHALDKLRPEDTLTIIAFGHDAKIVLPPTVLSEREKILDVIHSVDRFEVDPGGTAMDEGMRLALQELGNVNASGRLGQMMVLTDGETSGELNCRELAQVIAKEKKRLAVMGVGTEWNAGLIKELARLSDGKWYFIDAEQAGEVERIFEEEFDYLTSALFMDVQMQLRPVKDVKVKRCRLVVPEIKDLPLEEHEENRKTAALGVLEKDNSTRYILDLSLPQRPDGNYVICQIEVTYQVGGKKESTGLVPLQIAYTAAGNGYINAEVAKHIDEVQIFELNDNLQRAIDSEDKREVERLASTIERKATMLGPRAARKTMLARQVLDELNAGGRISRKTQIAMEDSARMAEEM